MNSGSTDRLASTSLLCVRASCGPRSRPKTSVSAGSPPSDQSIRSRLCVAPFAISSLVTGLAQSFVEMSCETLNVSMGSTLRGSAASCWYCAFSRCTQNTNRSFPEQGIAKTFSKAERRSSYQRTRLRPGQSFTNPKAPHHQWRSTCHACSPLCVDRADDFRPTG